VTPLSDFRKVPEGGPARWTPLFTRR
jgi:hypothetical protein